MQDLSMGDIVFVRSKGIIPSLIRFFDPGRWNHCTIMLNGLNCLNANFGQVLSIQPFDYSTEYEVVDIGLTEDEKQKLVNVGLTLVGTKYDNPLIVRDLILDLTGIDIKWNNPKKYICCEMMEYCLKGIGKLPENVYLKELTPNRLYDYLKTKFKKDVV